MEDEECLPENSSLKEYLQSLGIRDMEIKKSVLKSNTAHFDLPSQPKVVKDEFIEETVIKQIKILLSTELLFGEDVRKIDNLLSHFEVKKYGMLRYMFKQFFGIFIIFAIIFYWILGNYVFIIGSSFYAYKAAEYLWTSHSHEMRLKELASVIQSTFFFLNKTGKFIAENNKHIQSYSVNKNDELNEFKTGFSFYNNFVNDYYYSLGEVIDVLSNSTKKLISKLPLYEYIDDPQSYVCNNINRENQVIDLTKLYLIYLLVQSEFLKRFILNLIPSFNMSKNSNFLVLNKILTEPCVCLLKVKNNLNKKFKFIFFNGIYHAEKNKINLNTLIKQKNYNSFLEEEFAYKIYDVSNSFQKLLLKSRVLEENFKSKKVFQDLENYLINMQTELKLCQKNISDGLILLKKTVGDEKKSQMHKVEEDLIQDINNETEKVQVGYSDLNPKVEDEIFEAFIGEDCEDDFSTVDDWYVDDLQKQLEKEHSKNVIRELKTKLIDKAKNWEKREAEILLKKKGTIKDEANETSDLPKQSSDLLSKSEIKCTETNNDTSIDSSNIKKVSNKKQKKKKSSITSSQCTYHESETDFESSEQLKPCDGIVSMEKKVIQNNSISNGLTDEEFHQNSINFINKNFLNDLNCAREKIFKTNANTEELYYCDYDEDLE